MARPYRCSGKVLVVGLWRDFSGPKYDKKACRALWAIVRRPCHRIHEKFCHRGCGSGAGGGIYWVMPLAVLWLIQRSELVLIYYGPIPFLMCSIWTLPTSRLMSEWLPAWWALWLPWWPPAGCNNASIYYSYHHEFLLLFYCCALLEIKLTTTK